MLKLIAMYVFTILLMTASAMSQQSVPLNMDDPDTLARLLQKYDCHSLVGKLAVFGTLHDDKGNSVSPAWVELVVNGVARGAYSVRDDGTYCIRYDPAKTITELVFGRRNFPDTCVEQISGDRSHYINKVFANTCFKRDLPLHISALGHSDTKGLGSLISREYLAIQMSMVASTREDLRFLTARFETTTSSVNPTPVVASPQQNRLAPSIQPVDPQLLIAMAEQQHDLANLLRIGPFVLCAIQRAPSVNVALLQRLAFRENEIIPSGTAVTRLVFVPRASLSLPSRDTTKGLSAAIADLGTLVVTARGVSTGEEFRFSYGLADEPPPPK